MNGIFLGRVWMTGLLLALAMSAAARAGESGVTVVGSGEARGKPNVLEFHTRLGGSGELSGDALVRYREFKRRTLESVEKLQQKQLAVAVGGTSLTAEGDPNQGFVHMFRMQAEPAANAKPGVTISSLMRISVRGIDELPEAKVLELSSDLYDRLTDGGVALESVQINAASAELDAEDGYGQPPLAVFVLEDATKLRELARERAFAAARESAERLARLAGVELGAVEAIQEMTAEPELFVDPFGDAQPAVPQRGKLRLASRTFAEIPVRVSLQVRFGLKSKPAEE